MNVCVLFAYVVPAEARREPCGPSTGVPGGCKLSAGCWESSPDPLEAAVARILIVFNSKSNNKKVSYQHKS